MFNRLNGACLSYTQHRRKSDMKATPLLGIEQISTDLGEALRHSPEEPSIRLALCEAGSSGDGFSRTQET